MTVAARPTVVLRAGLFRNTQRGRFVRFPAAVTFAELAVMFLVSAIVDLFDDADVTVAFGLAGAVCATVAAVELRRVERPRVTSAPAVFTMATISWMVLIAGVAIGHLLADVTSAVDVAIFEGSATSTTTAMTSLDPSTFPMGLHLFRALAQWIGGLGGLIVGLVVIPLVFGGKEMAGRGRSMHAATHVLSGRTRGTANLVGLYVALTVALGVGFAVAGMGGFDAVVHAMATASTGGLSTEPDSLAAFSSAGVEWVATAGMAVAGVNLGVIWWVVKGDTKPLRRSNELKLYLVVLLAATAVVALWLHDTVDAPVRTAAVQVTSAMSTTGFVTVAWRDLDSGVQTLLILLIGIGTMAGSAGGGFRYLRLIGVFGFAHRELVRQLHPSAVRVVRIDGRAISERTLERLNGYMVVFAVTSAAGAALVALGDDTIGATGAITLTVSALSIAGPHLSVVELSELEWVSKLTLSVLMLFGRLTIYAVILTFVNVVRRLVQHIDLRKLRAQRA